MHIRTFATTFSLALGFFTTGDAQNLSTKDQIVEKSQVISPPHRRVDNDQKCIKLDLGSGYLDYDGILDLYDVKVVSVGALRDDALAFRDLPVVHGVQNLVQVL